MGLEPRVAICRLTGEGTEIEVALVFHREYAYDPEMRRQILGAADLDVRAIAELHVRIGEAFATACLQSLEEAAVSVEHVDIIGSHGQTVYHHSGIAGALRATIQLGDGDVIAVRTGCHVFADFRARDIAAGGEGAPLSPIADTLLFGTSKLGAPSRRAILNLGGIANLTVLHEDPTRVFGFDTGPANAPLDRLARRLSGGVLDYDRDGFFARAGRVNERLLADLLAVDLCLARRPPKSTGFEMYGDAFVARAAARHGGYDTNLMATLVEFAAKTIALGICQSAELGTPVAVMVMAGGGVKNTALIERIAALVAPLPVPRSDDLGVPSDAREAMVFGVLADMTLRGMPAFLPPVTGAIAPKLLGKLSFP
jgi:anhydro-N-acetylmuramic acid kinase